LGGGETGVSATQIGMLMPHKAMVLPTRRTVQRQLSQPRVAEVVADELRARIVNGDLPDGSLLPRQEDLVDEFRISLPSLREAMRILETEGLISVRRGNVGGAVVHRPHPQAAAFMLGLVLQANQVVLGDLAAALRIVEPTCARLCAEQPERSSIAQLLRGLNAEARAHEAEGSEFNPKARQFHDALALSCGNGTMREVVGTLEFLWSDYVARWTDANPASEGNPTIERREEVVAAHNTIADAIADGDAEAAELESRRHLEETQRFLLDSAADEPIAITRQRGSLSPLGPGRLMFR
jgi:GntR family transcriptional regulator, transcriptional repressor for pyruvate dehydrogenase complex